MTHVFPEFEYWDSDERKMMSPVGGLSKRELFAAMCLQGLLSRGRHVDLNSVFGASVRMADALITALANVEVGG